MAAAVFTLVLTSIRIHSCYRRAAVTVIVGCCRRQAELDGSAILPNVHFPILHQKMRCCLSETCCTAIETGTYRQMGVKKAISDGA